MPTWSGIIQDGEIGKANELPAVEDGDLVVRQIPVKAQYEQAWRY